MPDWDESGPSRHRLMVIDLSLSLYFLSLNPKLTFSTPLLSSLTCHAWVVPAAMLGWCSDLQPSLDRVRSASTTCLRPEPNFHFLDRDRYRFLFWKFLFSSLWPESLPCSSTCSVCRVFLVSLSLKYPVILLLIVAFMNRKNQNQPLSLGLCVCVCTRCKKAA